MRRPWLDYRFVSFVIIGGFSAVFAFLAWVAIRLSVR